MDWNAAIERNREALKRILAALVAMAGAAGFTSPLRGGRWSPDHRVGVIVGTQPPPDASRRPPLKGEVTPDFTLPRHLHRAVLRLLRPAEAAARRLIIVAARGIVVPPVRPRKPEPASPQARKTGTASPQARKTGMTSTILRNGVGTGILMPPHLRVQASLSRTAPQRLALPLLDPLRPWGGGHRPVARSVPRISVPGYTVPFPVPAPPSPGDPIDASRLLLRLQALGRVLDNLPAEARRFARWQALRAQNKESSDVAGVQIKEKFDATGAQIKESCDAGPFRRVWPLRPGRPPGWCRRPSHEVHDILNVTHGLAIWALERPDTS